jgi:hypothetical protein
MEHVEPLIIIDLRKTVENQTRACGTIAVERAAIRPPSLDSLLHNRQTRRPRHRRLPGIERAKL